MRWRWWAKAALDRRVAAAMLNSQTESFLRQARDARRVQRERLFRKISRCADTGFSRDHRLDEVRTVADFRRNVPVASYEAFRPYIEQVARGDLDALLPAGARLEMFATSSGTTGAPKLIPVTDAWLKEYFRASRFWWLKAALDHPEAFYRLRVLSPVGNWETSRTAAGVPCGMVSGLTMKYQSPLFRQFQAVPQSVFTIPDAAAKSYLMLRLAIPTTVRLIVSVTPSTLERLARFGNEHRESLIRDIADGTLSREFDVPADLRRELEPRLRVRRPDRAYELEAAVVRTGTLYPKDYWDLSLISCWLGGTVGAAAKSVLPAYYGDTPARDVGLVASEGRMTIPLEDGTPAGVLDVASHYYEFVPEEEIDSPRPTTLECHELQEGRNYFIVLTTSSGLFRYDLSDKVRCVGYVGEAPLLEFLNKGSRFADLEGEKLSEHQLVAAVVAAAGQVGLNVPVFTGVPVRPADGLPHYVLLAEATDVPREGPARRFLNGIDRHLAEQIPQYARRRREGYLGPPRLVRLPAGSWSRFAREEVQRRGTGHEQYKHPYLCPDDSILVRFGLIAPTAGERSTRIQGRAAESLSAEEGAVA